LEGNCAVGVCGVDPRSGRKDSPLQGVRARPEVGTTLRYTVTETLRGNGGTLKEYVLGVEVFGRSEAFDPRIDPIVRVQAGKLLARLKEQGKLCA
jgi:hypothetical protein